MNDNKGYETFYLGGYGVYLWAKEEYALEFYRLSYGMRPIEVLKKWKTFAQFIIGTDVGTSE